MPRKDVVKIALIYPPYQSSFTHYESNIKSVKSNYGVIPCLSLLYVGGILQKVGCQVRFYDIEAMHLSKRTLRNLILDFRPDYCGFTITTYLFHNTLEWIRFVKSIGNIPVIVGGVHIGIYPQETLSFPEIDYGVIGEAEETLPELMEALINKKSLREIKGICYRNAGEFIATAPRGPLKDLDTAPFPSRNLIPNHRYYTFISQRKNFTALITSRGCPFQCIYCEQGHLPFRARSAKDVVDEIEECHNRYRIKEFDFFDSSFTIQKIRVLEICDEIRHRGLKIFWSARSRIDTVDEEMLEAMVGSGCVRLYYGIESGDSHILEILKKETNIRKIKAIVKLTKQKGISTFGYFMIGNPGENKETINKTIQLAKDLDLEYAQFSNVIPMPRTELYDMSLKEMGYDYWRNYILDRNTTSVLKRPGTSLTDHQIKTAVRKAYLDFYLRPNYILKMLRKIKSLREFWRYIDAVKDMVFERIK